MKSIFRNILFIFILALFVKCDEEEMTDRAYPRLKTLPVNGVTAEGATFSAEILLRGGFEVINYGFVWGESENPVLEDGHRFVYSDNIQTNTFSADITVALKENVKHYVRSFIQTNDFIVYGENVAFLSLGSNGPSLLDFTPKEGHLLDTIRISGESFGNVQSDVQVRFGSYGAYIHSFSEKEISVLVPRQLAVEKSNISISVAGNVTSFSEEFTLQKPLIHTIAPTNTTYGSIIEIEGENFDVEPQKTNLLFRGGDGVEYPAEVISITNNQILTRVPYTISVKKSEVVILMNNFKVRSEQRILINDPVITSFSPKSGKTLREVTIAGENFSPVIANNEVWIDGYPAEIVSAENQQLVVLVPSQSEHIYTSREVEISVNVLDAASIADEKFTITDKWFRLQDLPFNYISWQGLTVNQKGYVVQSGGLWEFNPSTNSWISKTPFPDATKTDPAVFAIDNKIYVGTGGNSTTRSGKDFWAYDISTDQWTQKADFPGQGRTGALGFSIGSAGYLGTGLLDLVNACCDEALSDFWQYNASNDTWIQIADLPYARGTWNASSTILNDEAYVGLGVYQVQGAVNNQMFKYDKVNSQWVRIADYPDHAQYGHYGAVAATINGQAFFGSGRHPDNMWSFDGSEWNAQESNRAGRGGGFSFVINEIGYFGGGETGNEFWLFDISQPD